MNCVSYAKCQNAATKRIWCPTWIDANEGPTRFCNACSECFDPTKNKGAVDGQFFYNEEADAAFQSVEAFFPRRVEQFDNIRGMLQNAGHVAGVKHYGMMQKGIFVVDGKAWLQTFDLISRLGDFSEAKKRFPLLFQMPKED